MFLHENHYILFNISFFFFFEEEEEDVQKACTNLTI